MAGNVHVEPVAVSAQKPGNVALYVAVSEHGRGLSGLQAENFQIFENGVALDNAQIGLTLLPTNVATARHAVLLVDMSKTLTDADRAALAEALRPFIVRLRQRQALSLFAFDGAAHVHFISDFARDARAEPDEKNTNLDKLMEFSHHDSSSSLYGAVIDGSSKLDAALAGDKQPLRHGTVIVVAQNPDLAGRASEDDARKLVADSPYQYYVVTVGPWATSSDVSWLGKTGAERAASMGTIATPLGHLADAIDDSYAREYLISYCSPARAGTRELKLEVITTDEQGKKDGGSYETSFDASGFGSGCNTQAVPDFPRPKPSHGADSAFASAKPAAKSSDKPNANRAPGANHSAAAATASARPEPQAPIADPPAGLGYE
jgi:hypothetical protein